MSFVSHSPRVADQGKQQAIAELLTKTTHDKDFYVLLVAAALLAIGAIFTDSIPVLIASMIVAPLAYPILALGLGIVVGSKHLAIRSLGLLILACIVTTVIAVGITMAVGGDHVADKYISFTGNRFVAVIVAVVSGMVGAYGLIQPKVASAITGVAIAVSLMPPLTATGINFASGNTTLGRDALMLFVLNVGGILVASIVVFASFHMREAYKKEQRTRLLK